VKELFSYKIVEHFVIFLQSFCNNIFIEPFPFIGPMLYKDPRYLRFLFRFLPPKISRQPHTMTAINFTKPKKVTSKQKLMRQKRCRRKTSLMKKAFEYSRMCSADVCLGIRIRETGQVHILSADTSGFWAFVDSQLVCLQRWLG
jgi:hypothetical protein